MSIGAAGHTRTLSNVTDGTDAHDAVNKGQLDSAIAGISSGGSAEEAQKMADTAQHNAITMAKTHTDTEISKVLDSGSSTATGGFAIGKNAQASGDYSTSTGSGAVATGVNSTAIGGSAKATKDASVATGAGSEATGLSSIATGWVSHAAGDYSIATGDRAKAEGKNSVALGANSQAKNANEVNIGIWSDDTQTDTRTLSGLKDGVNPDEAVNKGQLDTAKASAIREANKHTDDEIGKLATEAQGYATAAQTAANKYTDDTVSKVNEKVLKDANTYTDDTAKKTLKTANEHTERRAVIAENNAVTRSNAYTDESSSRTLERANTYTNHRAAQAENNAVARSNAYTNKRFGELKNQVDRNEKRANGGIAGAMAMSTITGSGSGFGMALSGYRDQSAIAAGIQKSITPNTTVNVKVAWDSGNGVGAAAGFFTSW
ncbi:YadA-like family protein [Salmonella enterica subsp. diarizonae serovar 58:r:z53]